MMQIRYAGSIQKLIDGVKKANELLGSNTFYEEISKKERFDFTEASGAQIATSLKNCNLQLNVKTFKQHGTRKLGFEVPTDPTSIHINVVKKKLKRSVGSIAGTFIHEAVHAADADDESLDYPHNGNLAAGNEMTAPYWIGNLAIQMIDHPQKPVNVNQIEIVPHAVEDEIDDTE